MPYGSLKAEAAMHWIYDLQIIQTTCLYMWMGQQKKAKNTDVCRDHCQLNPAPFVPLLFPLPLNLQLQRSQEVSPARIPLYANISETYRSSLSTTVSLGDVTKQRLWLFSYSNLVISFSLLSTSI